MTRLSPISLLEPPYDEFTAVDTAQPLRLNSRGVAVVWFVGPNAICTGEFDWILNRPRGTSCAVVLPPPAAISEIARLLPRLPEVEPNVVVPAGRFATAHGVTTALRSGPRDLAHSVTRYLWRHRIIIDNQIRAEVHRIFSLAPITTTISRLTREMCLSRRTLGRHFEARDLPVPSHWLQFARILNVLLRAQSDRLALCKLAIGAGYPDGFTFSNQAKRLTGVRPSMARHLVGFEWLVEAWLAHESARGNDPSSESSTDAYGSTS